MKAKKGKGARLMSVLHVSRALALSKPSQQRPVPARQWSRSAKNVPYHCRGTPLPRLSSET